MNAADVYFADGSPSRNRLALLLTLGLHLLAALFWLQERRPHPATPHETTRMVTILLRLPAPAHARPKAPQASSAMPASAAPRVTPGPRASPMPVPVPAASHAPIAVPAAVPTSVPAAAAADTPPLTSTPSSSSAPAATSAAAPTSAPADAATLAKDPSLSVDGNFMAGLAKRQAGRVDRELRGGKSGVPTEADTPWARFERGVDAAHVESAGGVYIDSYTSPDGVVIYRERVGSRTICRRTGSVGLGIAGARGVNDAGSVTCPTGVTWKRED